MSEQLSNSHENLNSGYVDLYHKANDIRANGDLQHARDLYDIAHSKVDPDSSERQDQWRRCASLDMVIRCETDLQRPAIEVVETIDRYAKEIEKIYSDLHNGAKFNVPLNPRSIAELNDLNVSSPDSSGKRQPKSLEQPTKIIPSSLIANDRTSGPPGTGILLQFSPSNSSTPSS